MNLIISVIGIYQLILAVYAVTSWFPQAQGSTLVKWLESICEPYLALFHRFVPQVGAVSFDVLVGILLLDLVKRLLGQF